MKEEREQQGQVSQSEEQQLSEEQEQQQQQEQRQRQQQGEQQKQERQRDQQQEPHPSPSQPHSQPPLQPLLPLHPPILKKPQHPQQQYTVHQLFSIRKQSSNLANDQIYKRLTKSFHRIKKLRSQSNGNIIIAKQHDYENNPIRLTFKRAHDLYNQHTKTHLIVKRKIDKMRGKVDRIKNEVEGAEISMISEIDVNKIYARGQGAAGGTTATTGQGQGSIVQGLAVGNGNSGNNGVNNNSSNGNTSNSANQQQQQQQHSSHLQPQQLLQGSGINGNNSAGTKGKGL